MNLLGSTREQVENKLILLYLIDRLGIPLGSLQIMKLVLENRLMNYFLLQQCLNELCEGNYLLQESNEGKTFYSLTQNGLQTLSYFTGHIPAGIRARIESIAAASKSRLKHETLITADFTPESENKYVVRCRMDEDSFTLIDLTMAVGTKADARAVCENWKLHSQRIYAELIESLTKKRE